ncbi:MAG: ACP S-malonyltransferase [Polyangiaceae bacterium]|jgi:[acyl-carrier-protein] S-malonyltransferase
MRIGWLFPGQGSQSVGMCKSLLEPSPAALDVLRTTDAALGEPLSNLILEGPEDELTLTANAQPAIVAISCAVLAAVRERLTDLPLPAVAAGHSLGEYSALVAAGVISLPDALRVVRARGIAMQDAVPPGAGAMSAIMGLDADRVSAICIEAAGGEVVSPANFNAPGQIVIAGHAAAVQRACELAAAQKGRVIHLKVSAPFHCALMAPAARVLERKLAPIAMARPQFPIVANFNAQPNTDATRVKELLVSQVDGAVRWEESVRWMFAHGVTHALEIGPGKVLAGLVKRISKDIKVLSTGAIESIDEVGAFLAEG